MEEGMEGEWLYASIDDYGRLTESSYVPMMGSRIDPPIAMESASALRRAKFRIDENGTIIDGSPPSLIGRRLILHKKSSPPLGRVDVPIPSCTWRHDKEAGWTCA